MLLYETAMQVVPLMLIALFLDRRSSGERDIPARARKWYRMQDRIITCLCAVAFVVSLFVVAEVLDPSQLFTAVIIAALAGSLGLLFAQIWRRFDGLPPADDASEEGSAA
ncbi:hypothetical protein [Microbacterium murale]|uniref:Uncharacterized protein n=1 Tax=Microbacterium murale TaxID=1081040 RepID=A0ABQ1RFL4_9MICO|nr:hypothetical protein [Microbacterium murale]GGD65462.1 hypothetical protein GCM10007269_05880 [Microbacterium murale]